MVSGDHYCYTQTHPPVDAFFPLPIFIRFHPLFQLYSPSLKHALPLANDRVRPFDASLPVFYRSCLDTILS